MAKSGYQSLIDSFANDDVLIPHLTASLTAQNWPDSYTIEVDSSPYTGRSDGFHHASSDWDKDELYLYYKLHPEFKDNFIYDRISLTTALTFAMGSAFHAVIQTQLLMVGLLKSKYDIETPFVNERHKVRGNADGRLTLDDGAVVLFEFKSKGAYLFSQLTSPDEIWLGQVNIYMHELGLNECIILVMESGYPFGLKEFRVKKDPKLIKQIYDKFERVIGAIDADIPPRNPCVGCVPNNEKMLGCPVRKSCWFAKQSMV